MGSLWSFLSVPRNQKTLAWLGGGLVVAAGGIWAVVTYFWPHHEAELPPQTVVCAQAGIAAGRDASGNSITFNGGVTDGMLTGASSQSVSCAKAVKP